ncbi:unnamed protein product, partial [Meganyctiphanes norvegica]
SVYWLSNMIRIAALNDSYDGSSDEEDVGPSMEVLEAQATKCYNTAITSLAHNDFQSAEDQFLNVIENPFIEKAILPENYSPGLPLTQDLQMKYSSFKNLGNLKVKNGNYQESIEYYMDAVRLDGTEVTLWQRLGSSAIKVKDFELALIAFQEGLNVNPKHWPCVDQLLSVMFILKMYMDCLGLAINTLQRDPGFIKARAFTDKIFEEQPSLMQDVKLYFRDSGILFDKIEYEKSRGDKFIATCETLRPQNKIPKPRSPLPLQKVRKPISSLTWENLAQSLIKTYDVLVETTGMDFVARIDICDVLRSCNERKIEDKNSLSEMDRLTREEKKKLHSMEDDAFRIKADKPGKIQSRRQTIELGESQDSFMVSEKRRSTDSDSSSKVEDSKEENYTDNGQEISNTKKKNMESDEKNYNQEGVYQSEDNLPIVPTKDISKTYALDGNHDEKKNQENGSEDVGNKNLDENELDKEKNQAEEESEKDHLGEDIETEQDDDDHDERMEDDEENDDGEIGIHENEEENEGIRDDERTNETENAVNALKGIMGLHASETLNLNDDVDFEYNQDYPDFYEGNEFGEEGMERDYEVGEEEEVDNTEEDDLVEGEEDTIEGEEDTDTVGEEDTVEGEEDIVEGEEETTEGEEETVEGEEETAEGEDEIEAEEEIIEGDEVGDVTEGEIVEGEEDTIEEDNAVEGEEDRAEDEQVAIEGEDINIAEEHVIQEEGNALAESVKEDKHQETEHDTVVISQDNKAAIERDNKHDDADNMQAKKLSVDDSEMKMKESKKDEVHKIKDAKVGDEKMTKGEEIFSTKEESARNLNDTVDQSQKDEPNDIESEDKEEDGQLDSSRKPKRPKRGLERELEQLDYWGRRKTKEAQDAKRKRRTITNKYLDSGVEEYLSWSDLLRSFIPATLLQDTAKPSRTNLPLPQPKEQPSIENCSAETPSIKTKESESGANQSQGNSSNGTQPQQPPLPDLVTNLVKESKASDSNDRFTPSDASSLAMEIEIVTKEGEESSINQKDKVEISGSKNICTSDIIDQISLLPDLPEDSCSPAVVQQKTTKTDVGTKRKLDFSCIDEQEKNSKEMKSEKLEDAETNKRNAIKMPVLENGNELKVACNATSSSKVWDNDIDENKEVESFLMRYKINGGIFHLLQQLLRLQLTKNDKVWPLSSAKLFNEIYPRVRNHVLHGSALSISEDSDRLKESATMALTHWELLTSRYTTIKCSTPAKDHGNLKNPVCGFPEHLEEDMLHLGLMLGRGDIWVEQTPQFHVRYRWLQAQIHLTRGDNQKGVQHLELLLSDLDHLAEQGSDYVVEKARIEMDTTVISNTEIKRQLTHLQRSQNLEQVVNQYTDKQYKDVAELLIATFHDEPPKPRPGVALPSRQTQLTILVDSLFRIGQYKEVLEWGSESLSEAIGCFHLTEDEEKEAWTKTLMKLVDIVDTTIVQDNDIVYEVSQNVVSKLVEQIMKMLVVQLEQPLSAPTLPFETLQPWLLMHRLLHSEELQQQDDEDDGPSAALQLQQGLTSENVSPLQPRPLALAPKPNKIRSVVQAYPSTLFIVTAHDELGKHSWCSSNDGVLLLHIMTILLTELQRPLAESQRTLLHQALEQTSFCLYSHPSKKAKHKHLRDHGVAQIGLTLDGALQLYAYYRPTTLPDFQTSQIPSITDEVAALHKRLIALIPVDKTPESKLVGVEDYLTGKTAKVDYSSHKLPNPLIVDIYYLLGDYYFKNKEWTHAQKYYKLDLVVNPDRLDSWAPLGLSMKAQLETQLNSCEVILDDERLFICTQEAVRVLKRALELDEYHTNLWVELGTLVYQVHSHASRLLKQDLNPDISIEMFERLEKIKSDMLDQAEICFSRALKLHEESEEDGLQDERWFYCYMLGKVAEKQAKTPGVILKFYLRSANHLYMIGAKFPRVVNYNNPQYLAVEALELYYRVHAYILKFLLQKEGKEMDDETIKFFESILDKVGTSPFAKYQEKKKGEADIMDIDEIGVSESESKKRILDTKEVDTDEPPIKKSNNTESQGNKEMGKNDQNTDKNEESDDDIEVVVEKINLSGRKDYQGLVNNCLTSLRLCLQRFPEHYKSLYRLAHFYYTSKPKKDISKAKNYMLGCPFYQRTDYMPVNGLFHQRKIIIQAPKNSNLFHDIWRVPNDEIDRAGSFAAHMYRSVSLTLDILPELKDFFTILEVALAMKNVPDKDKKFLRDNERELLSEHATQVGLQAMKDKYKLLFKGASPVHVNRRLNFLLDVFRAYRSLSKHLPGSEPHLAKMLCEAYSDYKGGKLEGKQSLLKEAESFCNKNIFQQRKPQTITPTSMTASGTTPSAVAGDVRSAYHNVARRGRPPGVTNSMGRGGRGGFSNSNNQPSGDRIALQQAYKIYENLIHAQALLNSKELDQAMRQKHQRDLKMYQNQLLKFLHIPSVSQYFQSSLQGVGPAGSKLPPPPAGVTASKSITTSRPNTAQSTTIGRINSSNTSAPLQRSQNNQNTQKTVQQSNISALAARSQAHGISITSVSTTKTTTTNTGKMPAKQSMTVTMSPAIGNANSQQGSLLSVNRGSTGKNSVTPRLKVKVSPTSSSSVPKLPPGTTLSRPVESTSANKTGISTISKSTPRPQLAARPVPKVQPQPSPRVTSQTARQTTPTQSLPKSLTVVQNPSKGQSGTKGAVGSSFMDAFQASLGLASGAGRGRGNNKGGGTSPGGRIAQLDTNQLLSLAYGGNMPASMARGGRGGSSGVTAKSTRGAMRGTGFSDTKTKGYTVTKAEGYAVSATGGITKLPAPGNRLQQQNPTRPPNQAPKRPQQLPQKSNNDSSKDSSS